jgi:hypothetical protein
MRMRRDSVRSPAFGLPETRAVTKPAGPLSDINPETSVEFGFWLSRLHTSLRKEWQERLAMRVREKQSRRSHHERERQSARRKDDVKSDDVNDDRSEDHQSERDHSHEKEHTADDLRAKQKRQKVSRHRKSAEERNRAFGHRGLWEEMEKAVQPEDDEDRTEEEPCRERRLFHGRNGRIDSIR